MSTYSTNLKIELIADGDQTGTWGQTTNVNLGTALEEAISGRGTITFTTDADKTITIAAVNTSQAARCYILNVVSSVSLTATRALTIPSTSKPYLVENNTTGGQSITVKAATGTGVTLASGERRIVYFDGTNVVSAVDTTTINGAAITNSTVNSSVIGGVTPAAGTFTTLVATAGTLNNVVIGGVTPAAGTFTTLSATAGGLNNVTIGASVATTGKFTSVTASANSNFTSTDSLGIPSGTTAQRGSPTRPSIRYNETLTQFEGYTGSTWGTIGGGATGGGTDRIFTLNGQTVTTNYSIPSGQNAMTAGPITIADGVTVTVPDGATWTIV